MIIIDSLLRSGRKVTLLGLGCTRIALQILELASPFRGNQPLSMSGTPSLISTILATIRALPRFMRTAQHRSHGPSLNHRSIGTGGSESLPSAGESTIFRISGRIDRNPRVCRLCTRMRDSPYVRFKSSSAVTGRGNRSNHRRQRDGAWFLQVECLTRLSSRKLGPGPGRTVPRFIASAF